ncbi:MAG TPA: thioredoxin family protein, partial [Ignavibacteriales bacterium]|nr:thioredoxin family protein [Ignavibacteriales bacterium]
MKKALLIICCMFISSVLADQSTGKLPVSFDPSRNAEKDVKAALEEAKTAGKRVLLDVGGSWCSWCKRLDAFIEENSEIKNLMASNFVTVKINFSPENKNEAFLSKYPKVDGYPHFFVLESDGKLLHSQNTGELEQDLSYSKDKMLAFIK